jgi:hypothetical protein
MRMSAGSGKIETVTAAELTAARTGEGTIRSVGGRRAGSARSTAATIRFNCGVNANAATKQIRGSAYPEKKNPDEEVRGVSKSRAISIAVTSHWGRCAMPMDYYEVTATPLC